MLPDRHSAALSSVLDGGLRSFICLLLLLGFLREWLPNQHSTLQLGPPVAVGDVVLLLCCLPALVVGAALREAGLVGTKALYPAAVEGCRCHCLAACRRQGALLLHCFNLEALL